MGNAHPAEAGWLVETAMQDIRYAFRGFRRSAVHGADMRMARPQFIAWISSRILATLIRLPEEPCEPRTGCGRPPAIHANGGAARNEASSPASVTSVPPL
jgi:hypothetical protein